MNTRIYSALILLTFMSLPLSAQASNINPWDTGINVNLTGNGRTLLNNLFVTPNVSTAVRDNSGNFLEAPVATPSNSDGIMLGGDILFSWDVTYDPDPFLFASFTLTNLSANEQTFNLGSNLLIDPQFSGLGLYGGSIRATVFDQNSSGAATLSTDTQPGIYKGSVAGSPSIPELNLLGAIIECNTTDCNAFGESSEGLFGNTVVTTTPGTAIGLNGNLSGTLIGVTDEIDIDLNFILSAGDRAQFQVYYEVAPVPLPAAVWLLGSALIGLFGVVRKQRQV